ncbi:MAG: DUF2244 domain-containing protein [Gemmobacter sp.]|nr:DUF2244 domain-containing protein [Gemmobacter sp.]
MPYAWTPATDDAPETLRAWPYRSLPRRGFALTIGFAALMLLVPLLPVIGSPVLWGLLPFFVLAVWGLWAGLMRSYRDAELTEELRLSHDLMELVRRAPRKAPQSWQANPYWVQVRLHPEGGPVPEYLTLKGGAREVELGAFLSPEERVALAADLNARLRALR